MNGLEKISEIISDMTDELRQSQANTKLINLQRLLTAIEPFSEMEISMMFNISMKKRSAAINTLKRLINEQERHIVWLTHPRNKLNTTPEHDSSIDEMYKTQRAYAEKLGLLPFTND